MGKSEMGDLRRKERDKIRRWTRAAPREKAMNNEERACTNVQKEKKNKNERDRQIKDERKNRSKKQCDAKIGAVQTCAKEGEEKERWK